MRFVKILLLLAGVSAAALTVIFGADHWIGLLSSKNAGAGVQQAAGPRALPVDVARSGTATFQETVEAVGSTRARQYINVVPLAAGRIERITFQGGEQVKAGQVLVELDARTQKVSLKEAEASLAEASSTYKRITDLRKRNVSSEATMEQARAAYYRAEAAVDRAKHELADRTLRAPFAGIIGLRQVEEGARIDTSTVVASLDDLTEVEVEFSVPEIYFPRVSIGQLVSVRSDAFGERTFQGRITTIDSRISASSRTFKARATIPNQDMALRTGMFVSLELVLNERQSPAVPEEAIVSEGDKTYVYAVQDGKARRVEVKLGLRHGRLVEVREGLDSPLTLVTSGVHSLEDGMTVKPSEAGDHAVAKRGMS